MSCSGRAGAGGVVDKHGNKGRSFEGLYEWEIEQAHAAAYDPEARMELLDEIGIWAQIIFPGVVGLGGQQLGEPRSRRRRCATLCLEIFNDASARAAGGVGQPAVADGDPARVGHGRVRTRGATRGRISVCAAST